MSASARLPPLASAALVALLASCTGDEPAPRPIGRARAELTDAERRERAALIRDVAARRGITNGLLLAGIADNETGLAHCWSEATWACMGPDSSDCGGPVIAGAADGPCSAREGGLGMFQFDAGTYDDTLAREGDRILQLEGNVQAAVDFVIDMVIRSEHIEGVSTAEEAKRWMNDTRPSSPRFDTWIRTVTHYYNGCVPGSCSVYDERFANYHDKTTGLLDEMGEAFWYGDASMAECEPIPASGRVVDETGGCFEARGTFRYWRRADAGYDGSMMWTHTTEADAVDNHGIWRLDFAEAGHYRVEAHIPEEHAQSRRAAYLVTHEGTTEEVPLDQSAGAGFRPLGTFAFAAGDGQRIRLDDNTGEPFRTRTRIAFDAVRLTPVEPGGDAGAGSDAGMPPGDKGGGCSAGSGPAPSAAGALVTVVALGWAGRRRRRG